ncbi:MAG: glycosyltransferase family 9 protein [Verrucomicrobiae bacterium]|nr:glycosyltransferase family 9 protein [Verrucomicrobiae bacterium]
MTAFLAFVSAKGIIAIIQALPLPLVWRAARLMGALLWKLDWRRRAIALGNLQIAFPDSPSRSLEKIGRESLLRVVENAFLNAWMGGRRDADLISLFAVKGVDEHLHPALAREKGVVTALFHHDNWEAATRVGPLVPEVKFSAVYQPLRNPRIDRLVASWRRQSGLNLLNRHEGFAQAITRLRANEVVAIFTDQHAGDHGMWIPFFQRLALTTPLPAILSRRTGAAIVPVFCHTDREALRNLPWNFKNHAPRPIWTIEFCAPVKTTGLKDGEILYSIHKILESAITTDPTGWFWIHKRWKTPSPGIFTHGYRRGIYVPPGMPLKPFRLLIRGVNWLGDSLLTLPALQAIRKGRPDCHLTLLTHPKLATLWQPPLVDDVITSLSQVNGKTFDAAILFPNSFRSAWEALRLGIPRRFGYAGHWRRRLLTATCPKSFRAGHHQHEVNDFLGLAQWCGAKIEDSTPRIPPASKKTFPLPVRPYLVIHPGAAHGSAKRWLPDRFVELVRRHPEHRWILIGNTAESERNTGLAAQMGGQVENWTGRCDLQHLAELLRHADAVICNDSGPMHLAAAVGAPVAAIFGSTEHRHTGPLGTGHRILHHPMDCSPCYQKECPKNLECMRAITVEEIEKALQSILAEKA